MDIGFIEQNVREIGNVQYFINGSIKWVNYRPKKYMKGLVVGPERIDDGKVT